MTLIPPASSISRRGSRLRSALALLLVTATCLGCVTPWERQALIGGRETTIDNVQGPTQRRMLNLFRREQLDDYANGNGSLQPLAGTDDYLAAEALYEEEDYEAAQKAFHKVAKKYKKSEIREDALYMEGEAAYQRGHYAKAQDKYSELLKEFPSSRHLDDVSRRLFEIARMWLDFPEAAELSEVSQVNYENFGDKLPAQAPAKTQGWGVALWPNMTDKSRPLFDPEGNGVGALRLIWLNDPTGPLADDALMLAASHYARTGNFIEADRHYTLLREEYPNSPHVQSAFVLGSHVKLMSYEGPVYDNKSLEDAEHLKQSTLRLYPEMEGRQRLEGELKKIEYAKAHREWEQVIFQQRKNNPRGEAVYCFVLLQKFPDTPYAEMARKRLAELGPEYSSGQALMNPQPDPPKYRQTFGSSRPQLTNTPSSYRTAAAQPRPTAPEESAEQPAEQPRRLPFRRGTPNAESETAEPSTPRREAPEKAPAEPRRFFPWGGDEDSAAPPADSPANPETPPSQEETVSATQDGSAAEDGGESGGRWSRMFRFTPPKLLRPSSDAKPINEDAADSDVEEDGPSADEEAGAASF